MQGLALRQGFAASSVQLDGDLVQLVRSAQSISTNAPTLKTSTRGAFASLAAFSLVAEHEASARAAPRVGPRECIPRRGVPVLPILRWQVFLE